MHTMNAIVLAINAYQHYQHDVEDCFVEIETTMSVTRTHSHAQATDVSKLSNELTKMKKEFTTQTRTLAKESAASREQVTTLKSRLVQAERDLNDANTQCAPALVRLCSCAR
jgi:seryl-tRNA synthetase